MKRYQITEKQDWFSQKELIEIIKKMKPDDKKQEKSEQVSETFENFATFNISTETQRKVWQEFLETKASGIFELTKLGSIQGGGVRLTCKVQ